MQLVAPVAGIGGTTFATFATLVLTATGRAIGRTGSLLRLDCRASLRFLGETLLLAQLSLALGILFGFTPTLGGNLALGLALGSSTCSSLGSLTRRRALLLAGQLFR